MEQKRTPGEGKFSSAFSESKKVELVHKSNKTGIVLAALVVIIAGGAIAGKQYLGKKRIPETQAEAQTALNEDSKNELLDKIKKHVLLFKEGEDPLIIRIDNAQELVQKQAFFANSQDGDVLVVYKDKALIYRPSEDVLINVGPVYIMPTAGQPISLDIRNGSNAAGKASELSGKLAGRTEFEVVKITNTEEKNYQGNKIVNLTGKDVSVLAQELGAEVINAMPAGELGSDADVVVILGN